MEKAGHGGFLCVCVPLGQLVDGDDFARFDENHGVDLVAELCAEGEEAADLGAR